MRAPFSWPTLLCLSAVVLTPLQAATPKVLILGIDGCRPDALAVANTPHIDGLKEQGTFSDEARSDPHTKSGPAWSGMFTGVWGDKHGVVDNSLAGARYDLFPNFFVRLEAANPSLSTFAFVRWPPITGITAGADLSQAMGSDGASRDMAVDTLTNQDPDVLFVHFLDVDSVGHASGFHPTVPDYVDEIEEVDTQIGEILAALNQRPTLAEEDWLIIVLTDHGGLLNGTHGKDTPEERTIFYLAHGTSAGRGPLLPAPAIIDVCATVLLHMGLAIQPEWNLDSRPAGLPQSAPTYGTNLIYNGDAEYASGTNNFSPDRGIAWWTDTTPLTVGVYGSHPAFPRRESPGPEERGSRFFLGGATDAGQILQIVDLSALAAEIDIGLVAYHLSGYLGGTGASSDQMSFQAAFLNADRILRGLAALDPVTATDRSNQVALLQREWRGTLPSATRFVRFTLTATAGQAPNTALADNLSFVLSPPAGPFLSLAGPLEGGQWQVTLQGSSLRQYRLHRSLDFQAWNAVGDWISGTDGPVRLTDDAPPSGQAFYRVEVSGLP